MDSSRFEPILALEKFKSFSSLLVIRIFRPLET